MSHKATLIDPRSASQSGGFLLPHHQLTGLLGRVTKMSKMNNASVAAAVAATARTVPIMDRAQVIEILRREGAVLVDGGGDYEILLTSATRWVFETDSESPWGLVPAWGAGTLGYAANIFAVLDGVDTIAAQDARHAAQVEAVTASQEAFYGRGCNPGLCFGCEEAGQVLPGHFDCTFTGA